MEIEKKLATINDYILLHTLGEGLNSKVMLAQSKKDGNHYALKIINENAAMEANMKAVLNESKILQQLDHPNIVKLYELSDDGVYTLPNGQTKKVLYAIIQLAQGGEVFDFLSVTGRFSEPVARYYFRQLVEALDHCHSKGFAHRDLKPENLLFDANFNLLLADFGFSTLMAGKDGSGKLKTILGTDNYMAPEIHSKNPYIGSSVDLFAAGIILFIFLTGHPPFNHAKATDSYYSLICMNNHEKFWHFHSRKKPNGAAFFSAEFMNLINAMIAFDPTQRPSIAEIKSHAWYRGEVPTHEQVLAEFQQRKAKVEEENEKKKREIEARRQQRPAQGGAVFQGIQARFRSGNLKLDGEEDKVEDLAEVDSLPEIKLQRALPVLAESTKKRLNNYYSAFAPEDLIKVAFLTAQQKAKNVEFLAEEAKISCRVFGANDSATIELKFFTDESATVLEFSKKDGCIFEFGKFVETVRTQLDKIEKDTFDRDSA